MEIQRVCLRIVRGSQRQFNLLVTQAGLPGIDAFLSSMHTTL